MIATPTQATQPLQAWWTPRRFAGALAILLACSFPMVLAGLEAFAYLDYGQFAYPVAVYQQEALARGELPFWNPLSSCGIPFLAQWNVQALYPLSWLYLALPLPWSLGAFCIGHLFLGGLGAYFLAVRWTGNRLAGALAGTVFAFNGFGWYAIVWPHITAALGWAPWVVLANERAWTARGRPLAWAVAVSAMQLLSGGAEVILLTWVILAGLFVVRLRAASAKGGMAIRAVAVGLLALALASPQLLPFLDLLANSQRSSSYGSAELGVMPVSGWANYLVPLFHTLRNPQGLHVPPNHWVGSYYLGIAVMVFAVTAVARVRSASVWVLAGLSLFGIFMAMGGSGPLYGRVADLLPGLGFVRFPVKFLILATFALPFVAASGLDWWTRAATDPPGGARRLLGWIVGTMAVLMALIAWWSRAYPLTPIDPMATLISAITRAVVLAAVAAWLVFLLRRGSNLAQRTRTLVSVALIGLVWLDLRTQNADLSPTINPAVLQKNAIRDYFQWGRELSAGHLRLMQSPTSYDRMLLVGYTDLAVDTQGRRLGQFFNFNLLDGIPKVDGFYSLYPQSYSVLFDGLYAGTNTAEGLRDFLSVSLITHPTNIVDWVPRPGALPLATAGQGVVRTNLEAARTLVLSDGFDPRRSVYLPEEAPDLPSGPLPGVRVNLREFASHRLVVDVEAPAPSVVVVNQTFYPGWRAEVNGQATPVWRANYGFQAVAVPAGQSQVVLRYHERGFYWGLGFAAIGLLVTVVLARKAGPSQSLSQPPS